MKVLVLGGTADARKVVEGAYDAGLCLRDRCSRESNAANSLVYSVAGLVRTPNVPCDLVSGGFSQFGGLAAYVKVQSIDAIMDITHPFAEIMSATAVSVSKALGLPYARFQRPEWQQKQGDDWQLFQSWSDIVAALGERTENYSSILITVGQLKQHELDELVQMLAVDKNEIKPRRIVLRTAVEPRATLPESVEWIKAIGPFAYGDELALMQRLSTDVLISKNSGGEATQAKLDVARDLGLTVMMIQRPVLLETSKVDLSFESIEACVNQLKNWFEINNDLGKSVHAI